MKAASFDRSTRPAGLAAGIVAALSLLIVSATAVSAVEAKPGSADNRASFLRIEKYDGLVTVEAQDVSLQDILVEIARQCDVHLILQQPLETRVWIDSQRQPLATVLTRLLRQQSYLLYLPQQPQSPIISGCQRPGTLWIFSEENAGSPDYRMTESGGSLDNSSNIATLRLQLMGEDFRRKKDAIKRLRKLDATEAIELLNIALVDEDNRIRVSAIHALADFAGDDAIAALAGASGDEDAWVREEVSHVLGSFGSESAIDQLGHILRDSDDDVRTATILAFTEIGGSRSAAALSVLLRDEDPVTRVDAVDALGEIGGDAARPYLERALIDDDKMVRETAAEYLDDAVGVKHGLESGQCFFDSAEVCNHIRK